MTCLTDTLCRSIRDELHDEAERWWDAHESELRELKPKELAATALAMYRAPASAQVALSMEWRKTDYASWKAWQKSTTDTLRDTADANARARALLLDALGSAAAAILRAIGAALKARLGL